MIKLKIIDRRRTNYVWNKNISGAAKTQRNGGKEEGSKE